MAPSCVVFVHGWSVTSIDTYGALPERLAAEAAVAGEQLRIENVFLSRYVSFRDEVRMPDLAWAMECAIEREIRPRLASKQRIAVITHSTGGPVVRAWWYEYYARTKTACPMSHLVMLAPANFGSALAQLGKGRLSRLKSWFAGVAPGQGVLDWLEHGSQEAWQLNEAWIKGEFGALDADGVFPFVLTGQTIDRSLYDHLNSYTGELGGDGVVRAAAANLNAALVRLVQVGVPRGSVADDENEMLVELKPKGRARRAPVSAFRLIGGASHSGDKKGIMRSVAEGVGGAGAEVVTAIRRCLAVAKVDEYRDLCETFDTETEAVWQAERSELERVPVLRDRVYIHDRMSLVIIRLVDSEGHPLGDFDLKLTGHDDSPDFLPEGFLADRQRNLSHRNVLTFFLNHDLMTGCDEVPDPRSSDRRAYRESQPDIGRLGLGVKARPDDGFVRYVAARIAATPKLLADIVRPHETTMIEVVLQRYVHTGAFTLVSTAQGAKAFDDVVPGDVLPDKP